MSKTIAHWLKENNYEIGKDVIRVTPETKWNGLYQFKSNLASGMYFLHMNETTVIHGQGLGVIAGVETNEYFITLNRNITNDLMKKYKCGSVTQLPMAFSYNAIEFIDPKMQKKWEAHQEYMRPENVEARERAVQTAKYRYERRKTQELKIKKQKTKTDIKKIIHEVGFSTNDYVEVKDGMIDLGPKIRSIDLTRTIKLPTENDVEAKYYIVRNGSLCMIGNTDTNTAIVTRNSELIEAFKQQGFEETQYDENFWSPNHYGMEFKDPKMQTKLEAHLARAADNEKQLERAIKKYAIEHGLNITKGAEHSEAWNAVFEIRAKARASKRNVATESSKSLKDRYEKRRQEVVAYKQKKAAKNKPAEPVEQMPAEKQKKLPTFLSRLFRGGRQ